MATLKAQHLAKAYKSRQVVRDVSLSIDSPLLAQSSKNTLKHLMIGKRCR